MPPLPVHRHAILAEILHNYCTLFASRTSNDHETVLAWVRANSNWGETIVIVTGDHECGNLTGPGSDPDWEPLFNNGLLTLPGMEWHSSDHTNSLIPFFAKGDAARLFRWSATGYDPVRGK